MNIWAKLTTFFVLANLTAAVQAYAEDQLVHIEPSQVRVGGEIGRRIDITIEKNLLALDVENDFLAPFREPHDKGWGPGTDIVDMGKLINDAIKFAPYSYDDRVIALKNRLISELIKEQLPDGYIGIFRPEDRIVKEWDQCEMASIISAFRTDDRYFGNNPAREAADELWDYLQKGREAKGYPDVACGGRKARGDDDEAYNMSELVKVGEHVPDKLDDSIGNPERSRVVLDFLTKGDGMVITGAVGMNESWHNDQKGSGALGEICANARLISMLDNQMRAKGDSLCGDIMERVIYNALFGAQSPDGRRLHYFTPFEGKRIYLDRDTYCCPASFRSIIPDLPTMIYYRTADGGVAVNLYTKSKAQFDLDTGLPLTLWQETDYPTSGHVVIHLGLPRPVSFPLKLRIPRWCSEASVSVNGETVAEPVKIGSFLTIERRWRTGDQVTLEMPMSWRFVKGRKTQAGRVAVLRGPMVFCFVPYRARNYSRIDLPGYGPYMDLTKLLTIDPSTLKGPYPDETVRPDGMFCKVQAWAPDRDPSKPLDTQYDLLLELAEFPHPGGEAVYFKVPDMSVAVDDELYLGNVK
jgi:hypothetical protein